MRRRSGSPFLKILELTLYHDARHLRAPDHHDERPLPTYRHYQIEPPVSADPLPPSDIGNSQISFARVHRDTRPPPTYRHYQQVKEGARPINSAQSDVLLNRVFVHSPPRYSPYQTATDFSKPYHAPPATLDYDRFVNQNQPQSGQWSSAREAWLTREALRYEQGQRLPCYYMCTSV